MCLVSPNIYTNLNIFYQRVGNVCKLEKCSKKKCFGKQPICYERVACSLIVNNLFSGSNQYVLQNDFFCLLEYVNILSQFFFPFLFLCDVFVYIVAAATI